MTDTTTNTPYINSRAAITADGLYRFSLRRQWGTYSATVCWVMLNPSTADADKDDPTIRRCVTFSKSWGYDGMVVVNLYAYRATNPAELADAVGAGIDIRGPGNEAFIRLAIQTSSIAVAAWGAHRQPIPPTDVRTIAANLGRPLHCLGTTKDGSPRHPLFVKGDTHREPWASLV